MGRMRLTLACLAVAIAAPGASLAQAGSGGASRPALTLQEAQRIALERSPSIQTTALDIERAEAAIQTGWGMFLPQLGGSLAYTMADQPTVAAFEIPGMSSVLGPAQEIVIRQQHTAQLGLQVRQPLLSARAVTSLLMGHQARDLTAVSLERARRALVLSVARAFYAAVTARRTIGLLDRQLALAEEHAAAARARLDAQVGLAIDVARAELQVQVTTSHRENAALAHQNARDGLAMLMGLPPDDLPELEEPATPPEVSGTADQLVAEARRGRLDLEAARQRVRLAERELQTAWMAFAPSLDLSWSLSHTLTDLGGFGDRRTSWNLAVVASFPLFDGGMRYGQIRDRRAQIRQAELTAELLEQSAVVEVRGAYRRWRTALTTRGISERQLELATDAHRLAIAAYEAGAASNLEVVDAQRTLAGAEVDLELQRLSSQLALIELLAALEVPASGGPM